MAIRNEREGPPDKGGGRGEFDGPSSAPRPTQSASEKIFSNGIPFAEYRQTESPAPCEGGCSVSGDHPAGKSMCHCSAIAHSSSTRVDHRPVSCPLPLDASETVSGLGEVPPGEGRNSPVDIDEFLPPQPLIYNSGWSSVGSFEIRVALGEGPPNPALHAFPRRLLLLALPTGGERNGS